METKIKILLVVMAGVSFFCIAGCAHLEGAQNNNIGDTFIATNGKDSKLVRRNNDVYVEKLDGSDSKRITLTLAVHESAAFSANGKNVIYTEEAGEKPIYVQDIRQAPYDRRQITPRERDSLMQ